jgi:hypothetical protein
MATTDAAAAAAYKKIKLTEELRAELLAEFRRHSALRTKRVELEKQLEKLVALIKEKDGVAEILNRPEYKAIEVRTHREWLRDIEEEVAATYKTARRKQANTIAKTKGELKERKRESLGEKHNRLMTYMQNCGKQIITQKDLADALGVPRTQIGAWLKPLKIRAGVIVDVKPGSRIAGKQILVQKYLDSSKPQK